jgi:hypothetical protein
MHGFATSVKYTTAIHENEVTLCAVCLKLYFKSDK